MAKIMFFPIPRPASNPAGILAAGMLTMLTFVPIFQQSDLGHAPAAAGLMMLPMVLPLFIVPRVVSRHLAHRLSGRALLTLGLFIVCIGLLWLAAVVRGLAYVPLVGGMLVIGVGAGLLNGETTKVGMTVIPRERSGMASGVSGTVRFTGLVVGIAALGVVLYSRVSAVIADNLPDVAASDRQALVRLIVAGHPSEAALPGHDRAAVHALALASFAEGYRWLLLFAAVTMAVSAILTWRLVSADETPPIPAPFGTVGRAVR